MSGIRKIILTCLGEDGPWFCSFNSIKAAFITLGGSPFGIWHAHREDGLDEIVFGPEPITEYPTSLIVAYPQMLARVLARQNGIESDDLYLLFGFTPIDPRYSKEKFMWTIETNSDIEEMRRTASEKSGSSVQEISIEY